MVFFDAGVLVGILSVGLDISSNRKQTLVLSVTASSLGASFLLYGFGWILIAETFLVVRGEGCEWTGVRFGLLGDSSPPKP